MATTNKSNKAKRVTKKEMVEWVHIRCKECGRRCETNYRLFPECYKIRAAIIRLITATGYTPEDVARAMDGIESEHPLSMEFDTDARYVWPKRWDKLRSALAPEKK